MQYTLVVNEKCIMNFHILAVAELYQRLYGGALFVNTDDGTKLMAQRKTEGDQE